MSARLDGAISARRDGEGASGSAGIDAHLRTCADCRQWYEDATMITRIARIGLAVPARPVPDSVLDVAPSTARATVARWLWISLAVLGGIQALVGVAQIAGTLDSQMGATALEGATPDHMLHESAAWNLAIGAAYLFIAWRHTRPTAVIPILTAFVGVLTLFSLGDVLDGAVAASRLVSHVPVVLGYAIVLLMSHPWMAFDDPSGGREGMPRSRWRLDRWRPEDRPARAATLPRSARHDTPAASADRRVA
jgi:predicted anti-sigma-YlaC factor YlaD